VAAVGAAAVAGAGAAGEAVEAVEAAGSVVVAVCPAVEAPADHGNDASAIDESHR